METHMSDGNGGSGGNEAEDGGSSSAKGASPLTVPAEQDGSQSSTASRRWAAAAIATLAVAISSRGK